MEYVFYIQISIFLNSIYSLYQFTIFQWVSKKPGNAGMAELVGHPTIGFGLGHDLRGHGIKLHVGALKYGLSGESASVSLPLTLPLPEFLLSLSNKSINLKKKKCQKVINIFSIISPPKISLTF